MIPKISVITVGMNHLSYIKELYKSLYQELPYGETDVDFDTQLKECSRLIYEAEAKMESMNRILEG